MVHQHPSLEELFEDGIEIQGDPGVRPCAVVEDSREVAPGALFVARAGASDDGARYVEDALARGAAAILLAEDCADPERGCARALVRARDTRAAGARAAQRFHGDPARQLDVLAITGTNGKTTVAWLVRAILAAAGRRCGLLGTIEVDDGKRSVSANLTTPSACDMAALMARMVDNGCDSVVLEASSHALHQGRLIGVEPARAVYTNLSGDHLDYHGSIDAYAAAKAKLFDMLPEHGIAIVNVDCPMHEQITGSTSARRIGCSTGASPADARATIEKATRSGMQLHMEGPWGAFNVHVGLLGRHNAENLLLASVLAHSLGVDGAMLEELLPRLAAPPGRLEPVTAPDAPLTVLVDYAHTDDALGNVLQAVRPLVPAGGRLTVLFGCGGDRDQSKRPRMARVACEYADRVLVTSDNPRTESPEAIIQEILAGVPMDTTAHVDSEVQRARAIDRVIGEARPGEVVVIAGKGHEDYQILGTERFPFDDRQLAREVIERSVWTGGTDG